jgi:protein-L-isoaspartate(D-aspartate) O-methyltransferase
VRGEAGGYNSGVSELPHKPAEALSRMIRLQMEDRGIRDPRVLDAVRRTPRELFVSEEFADLAYADRPLPLGNHQTISQPYIVALMLERLGAAPEHRVLELGTGSGWQTAMLAMLAGEVYTIERIKPLLDQAWERVMRLDRRNVKFRYADGTLGWAEAAPFDRIILGAAPAELPRELLLSQLAEGGVAVLPVGEENEQLLVRVTRSGSELRTQQLCAVRFVPLISESIGPSSE